MRHLRLDPNTERCSTACPEYAEMLADAPVDEWDWYKCTQHQQWWRAVLSPDPDPSTGEQALILKMTERPPGLLLVRAALLERLQG